QAPSPPRWEFIPVQSGTIGNSVGRWGCIAIGSELAPTYADWQDTAVVAYSVGSGGGSQLNMAFIPAGANVPLTPIRIVDTEETHDTSLISTPDGLCLIYRTSERGDLKGALCKWTSSTAIVPTPIPWTAGDVAIDSGDVIGTNSLILQVDGGSQDLVAMGYMESDNNLIVRRHLIEWGGTPSSSPVDFDQVDTPSTVGNFSDLVAYGIGEARLVVSYWDASANALKVAREVDGGTVPGVTDNTWQVFTLHNDQSGPGVGQDSHIAQLPFSGLPIVTYRRGTSLNSELRYIRANTLEPATGPPATWAWNTAYVLDSGENGTAPAGFEGNLVTNGSNPTVVYRRGTASGLNELVAMHACSVDPLHPVAWQSLVIDGVRAEEPGHSTNAGQFGDMAIQSDGRLVACYWDLAVGTGNGLRVARATEAWPEP
ncbi:MAG TPA: hypothetical protein VEI97_01320, partial [bacterium]|nr:hypothetical protein [bacterium]